MNFILAIISMVIYYAIFRTTDMSLSILEPWKTALFYLVFINIALGIFNLIPIPPLDGSKILMHFLPTKARIWFQENQLYFYIVFIILFISHTVSNLIISAFGYIYTGLAWCVESLFNLF